MVGWWVGRSVGRSVGRWVGRLVSQSVGQSVRWSVRWFVSQLVGPSVRRSVSQSVGQSIGCLSVYLSVRQFVCPLVGWSVHNHQSVKTLTRAGCKLGPEVKWSTYLENLFSNKKQFFWKIDKKGTKIILSYFTKSFIIMMQTLNTKIVSFAEILNGKESAFIIPWRLVYIFKVKWINENRWTSNIPSLISPCVSVCIKYMVYVFFTVL